MKRVVVFPALSQQQLASIPVKRTGGKVILIQAAPTSLSSAAATPPADSITFTDFLQLCVTKVFNSHKTVEEENIRCFTAQGGEVSSLEELVHDDVLYVTRNGEEYDSNSTTSAVDTFAQLAQLRERVSVLERTLFDVQATTQRAQQHQQQIIVQQQATLAMQQQELSNTKNELANALANNETASVESGGENVTVLQPRRSVDGNSSVVSANSASSNELFVHPADTTIIIFINPKSGGQMGKSLSTKFKKHLGEEFVFEIGTFFYSHQNKTTLTR